MLVNVIGTIIKGNCSILKSDKLVKALLTSRECSIIAHVANTAAPTTAGNYVQGEIAVNQFYGFCLYGTYSIRNSRKGRTG